MVQSRSCYIFMATHQNLIAESSTKKASVGSIAGTAPRSDSGDRSRTDMQLSSYR